MRKLYIVQIHKKNIAFSYTCRFRKEKNFNKTGIALTNSGRLWKVLNCQFLVNKKKVGQRFYFLQFRRI